ncbi:MAG: DUF1508 domain-containing protein [Chloroflexota bacterium]
MAQFELDKNARGEYIWRLRANNGRIVADSAESYHNRADCESGINIVKREAPMAPIQDLTAR